MKVRNGFVSNSSSASFVIIGYKMDEIFTDKEKVLRKYAPKEMVDQINNDDIDDIWYDFLYNKEPFGIEDVNYLGDDGPGYIGIILADVHSDGDSLDNQSLSIEEVVKIVTDLQKALGASNPPKIYMGTRSC